MSLDPCTQCERLPWLSPEAAVTIHESHLICEQARVAHGLAREVLVKAHATRRQLVDAAPVRGARRRRADGERYAAAMRRARGWTSLPDDSAMLGVGAANRDVIGRAHEEERLAISDRPQDGEDRSVVARTSDGVVRLSDRRLTVTTGSRVVLDVDLGGLRRVQFDIEQDRPATLVIVPHDIRCEPQVLSVPVDEIPRVAEVLTHVSRSFRSAEASGTDR